MGNVSVSKTAIFEQRKRDGLQEQAIKHHTDALEALKAATDALIEREKERDARMDMLLDAQNELGAWAERFSGLTARLYGRLRWLLLGR